MQPESTLEKKHNSIAYHTVHKGQVAKIVQISHEASETDLADVLTN